MKKIKAVLFDMDGVLIDAKDWHYEALNKALALFGTSIGRYDHLTTFDGLPTKDKLQILSRTGQIPYGLHPIINELKQKFTYEMTVTKCHPVFYHEYALSNLKNMGYKLCVCSNSIRSTVELMMNRASLTEYLEFILSNEDVAKAKPNPEIYLAAIDRLKLSAEECLILEDNKNGIAAAKASGAHLLEIGDVEGVNLENILNRIHEIEVA